MGRCYPAVTVANNLEWKLLTRVRLLVTPWTIQSVEFSRPEYSSGWLFPSLGDLPNPGIEPRSPVLRADSWPDEPPGKPANNVSWINLSFNSLLRVCAVLCLAAQSCLILWDPVYCSPSGASVCGILQARILGLPYPAPGDLPSPEFKPRSPTLQVDSLPPEPPGEPENTGVGSLSLLQGIFTTEESNQGLLLCR